MDIEHKQEDNLNNMQPLKINFKKQEYQFDLEDTEMVSPNRQRVMSEMNYKQYISIFDKPPKRPNLKPCQNLKSIEELNEDFSLETKPINNVEQDE